MVIDASAWTRIGRSDNADFFEIEPRVLAVVPVDRCEDDEVTARASIRIQLDYLRTKQVRSGVLVFMDRILKQSTRAREVYRQEPDPALQACFALVGGTTFGRAVGSFFIGIHPPRVPTRMFRTMDEALAWARVMAFAPDGREAR
ncbi:MAG TPA: hypothetical protein VHV30_03425 [Polyangiaceae bacterium]|jgi:hypothetical protein|nr:hypothetical protein [Polyangiaceae bacterium]